MQLFVKGQQVHTIQVADETVLDLKNQLFALESIPANEQVILLAGQPLEDGMLLNSVPELSTLDLTARLLGGKVHGSLARAGKVKGQTPKVEKQEKKKKKTGRAKRRTQYNRRFVNVVATFGRKKGPNSNS
uniref:Putative ubiquitin-like protein Fubi/40S ribosomal protein RPS30 fusion protein n=1 Tax=Phoronis muelleri TaxID=478209 RepID=B2YI23_9BILA|nr:putative ubiquitin-like protein Fubi/40S ribosomal protein RPS30 fusion protein [Phoronis muelleri]